MIGDAPDIDDTDLVPDISLDIRQEDGQFFDIQGPQWLSLHCDERTMC